MRRGITSALLLVALALPGGALAAVRAEQPFPSNLFTELDLTQATALRVNLPKPDCAVRPSDCADIDVVNTLDGFNIQPRISIPFSGPIDVSTVSSQTVFLVGLSGRRIGINQIVWEPAANTLHVESDEQLAARCALPPDRHARRPRIRRAATRRDGVLARPALRSPARCGGQAVSHPAGPRARRLDLRRRQAEPGRRREPLHHAEHRRDLAEDPRADPCVVARSAELHARDRRRAHRLPALNDHGDPVATPNGNLNVRDHALAPGGAPDFPGLRRRRGLRLVQLAGL